MDTAMSVKTFNTVACFIFLSFETIPTLLAFTVFFVQRHAPRVGELASPKEIGL